jgi:hypothetical protein
MSDDGLELGLGNRLRAYADGGIRPFSATAIAEAAVGRRSRRQLLPLVGGRMQYGVTAGHRQSWSLQRLMVVAAAGLAVAVAGVSLLPSLSHFGAPAATPRPSASASVRPTEPPQPDGVNPESADYMIGRHSVTVDGVPFSFRIPSGGWEPYGGTLVAKNIAGPQGAEAIIFWAAYPDGAKADPCEPVLTGPVDELTAAELGAKVASAPGTEVIAGPEDTTVGGLPASHVRVIVREDAGCDPGFFYNWKAQDGGALWVTTELGDTIRVWAVETDSTLLFIGAETHQLVRPGVAVGPAGRAGLESDIREIIDSIEFE